MVFACRFSLQNEIVTKYIINKIKDLAFWHGFGFSSCATGSNARGA
jgi:hypothetical protein